MRTLAPPLLGCEEPRVWTPPLRALTPKTSLGYALIEFSRDVLQLELLPWQQWLAIHALEQHPDGTFRFRTILVLVARQSGKSTFLQILALFFLYVRGAGLVIGTAQNLDIAEEQWQGAVDIAESVPELAAEIDKVDRTNGKKALRLVSGERYKVAAASRRGGRGLSGDLVLLDELREHQTWEAWGAVTKTTMARELAQIWAASNAGDASSVVLSYLRAMAHGDLGNPDGLDVPVLPPEAGDDSADTLGIFEWSAVPACSVWDRDGWSQANPALGHAITERAISSAARTDPEGVFRTEVLCQWVERLAPRLIDPDVWSSLLDPGHRHSGQLAYALDVSPEGRSCAIAASDGDHIEIVKYAPGTSWVVGAAVAKRDAFTEIVLDPAGPAGALVDPLEAAGVTVRKVKTDEFKQACGQFLAELNDGKVHHIGQDELDAAVAGVVKRDIGDGGWAWSRKRSGPDICPLVAVTLARWAAQQSHGDFMF